MSGLPTYLILIFIWFFSAGAWIPTLLYLKSDLGSSNFNNSTIQQLSTKSSILYQQENFEILLNNNDNKLANSLLSISTTSTLLLPTSTSPNQFTKEPDGFYYNQCSVGGFSSAIIIPHSLFVYFLPIFFICIFYSRTIIIVNQKLKKRRRFSTAAIVSSTSQQRKQSYVSIEDLTNNRTTNNSGSIGIVKQEHWKSTTSSQIHLKCLFCALAVVLRRQNRI